MKRNIFLLFIQELTSLPLWVKQVILVYLKQDLRTYLSDDLIKTLGEACLEIEVGALARDLSLKIFR